VGIGRRPLLQKIATITVATSLTIAAADTFAVAQDQYYEGYLDSSALVDDVVNTVLIKIVRIISDSFLWLAQVQTLIRLFPRHKEKVTIKWLGFCLVSADIIFSILDSFISENPGTRPRSFQDAIPALNYLFELAISLIYASCVVYYALSKRRYAFWHPKMRNVCLVALISLISVLIPVVFFVLDISLPRLAGWGEYIRWVGAAAASVVVWEWVERIEALERDERKDGILGREIFDGDEMLGRSSSDDGDWHGRGRGGNAGGDIEKSGGFAHRVSAIRTKLPLRRRRKRPINKTTNDTQQPPSDGLNRDLSGANTLVPPQPAISPPSRSDTNSAASTVYAVRYHNLSSPSPAQPEPVPEEPSEEQNAPKDISDSSTEDPPLAKENEAPQPPAAASRGQQFWSTVPNPFKRRRAEPPAEVAGVQAASGMRRSPIDRTVNLRDRLGTFAAAQRDRFGRNGSGPSPPLPVMVIPAPKQNDRTWSPDDVRNSSSISSAGRGQPSQAGPSGHSRQASSDTQDGTNVVTIPAPTSGRTWSPQDAAQSSSRPAQTRQLSTDEPNTPPRQNETAQSATPNIVSTPRGALTINEEPGRTSRRNTYTRRSAQPSHGQSASTEFRSEGTASVSTALAQSPPVTAQQEERRLDNNDPHGKAPAAPAGDTVAAQQIPAPPSASRSAVQQPAESDRDSTAARQNPADGRDTGGTSSAPAGSDSQQ
jgi:hypothetical protein